MPVQHRPLYVRLSEISDKKDLSVWIEEPLKLERNHKYYIGIAVMEVAVMAKFIFLLISRRAA